MISKSKKQLENEEVEKGFQASEKLVAKEAFVAKHKHTAASVLAEWRERLIYIKLWTDKDERHYQETL